MTAEYICTTLPSEQVTFQKGQPKKYIFNNLYPPQKESSKSDRISKSQQHYSTKQTGKGKEGVIMRGGRIITKNRLGKGRVSVKGRQRESGGGEGGETIEW